MLIKVLISSSANQHTFDIFQQPKQTIQPKVFTKLYITLKLASINHVTWKESSKNTTQTLLLYEYKLNGAKLQVHNIVVL